MSRLIAAARSATRSNADLLIAAVERLPADQRVWRPLDEGRSALSILMECGNVTEYVAEYLAGGDLPDEEALPGPEDFADAEAACAYLEQATERLLEVLEGLSEAALDDPRPVPWDESMTLGDAIWIVAFHTAYHWGQVNYIQTLLGDREM